MVASPAAAKKDRRDVAVYVSDGSPLNEWLPGSVLRNSFSASSDDHDTEAEGKLSGDSVTGTVKLPKMQDAPLRGEQSHQRRRPL